MRTTRLRSRGSAVAYFLIILSLMVTGLITGMAMTTGAQSQQVSLTQRRDEAFYAAEAGIARAQAELEYGTWGSGGTYPNLTGTIGNCTYTVTLQQGNWNATIILTSTGTSPGSPAVSVPVTASLTPKYTVPAVSLGGNFDGGGGVHVTGDIYVQGSVVQHGNFTVTQGNIVATGSIRSGVNYDSGYGGTANAASVPAPPDVATIANTLKTAAGSKQITSGGTLDFTQAPNGVIYYVGNLSNLNNPNVIGDGTLVVLGDLSIKKSSSFSGHNVNIVATGNVSTLGGSKFDLAGSLYAGGLVDSQSQFSVQGVIVAQAGLNTQGQGGDVFLMPPPWFDPRTNTGQGGRTVKNFTGPIF